MSAVSATGEADCQVKLAEETSLTVKEDTTEDSDTNTYDILYTVDDVPPFGVMFSVAIQVC